MRGRIRIAERRVAGFAPLLAFAIAVFCTAGCSSIGAIPPAPGSETKTASRSNDANVGSVGLAVMTNAGTTVTALNWSISGPNAYSGNVSCGDAQSFEFVLGGITAANGYTITLSGTDSQNDPCSGTSAQFNVVAGEVTYAMVSVTCLEPTDATLNADVTTGSLAVEAGVAETLLPPIVCPGINSFTISPAEIAIGQQAALAISTIGPSATVAWSVSPPSGGTITNPTATNPVFTCSIPGQYAVTASIAPCTGAPFTTVTGLVNCEPACTTASSCPGPNTACSFPTCIGGLCGTQIATEGTPCSTGNSQICNGIGSCVPFTFDVVRIGNPEGGALGLAAAPVFIEQRNVTDGGLAAPPIALPTVAPDAGASPFVETGTAIGVGLARSADGHSLALVGYGAIPGSSAPANNSADSIVVARVDSLGNVNTSTVLSSSAFKTANSLRSAVSADGAEFWVSGYGASPSAGIWYVPYGVNDAGTQVNSSSTRNLGIFGGQLYGSGDVDAAAELFTVGSGLPDSGVALAALAGLPTMVTASTASPWAFVFLDMVPSIPGLDTLYVAIDNALPEAGVTMGVQRWSLNASGTSWSLTATLDLQQDGGATVGFRGLTGINVGGTATIIASTAETTNRIAVFTDDGVSSPWAGSVNVVAVAAPPAGLLPVEFFRGIALPPH
jgi:hypothetical protein